VVDDASVNDLRLDEPELAGRLVVVRNPVAFSAQQSRLIGSRIARGKFVTLLDSDDWWRSLKLYIRQLAYVQWFAHETFPKGAVASYLGIDVV
jgi:hypothetical protein